MVRKITCVVPARLASTRFPGKMLHPLLGTPIVVHTLRRAREAGCFDEILCLTDAVEIRDAALAAGFRAELSGPASNGTERIGRHLGAVAHDLVVNLQGDEPAFPPEALRILCRALLLEPETVHVLVHAHPATPEERADPNRCKAALDGDGFVLDFYRRAPRRQGVSDRLQMGAYGYGKPFLRAYAEAEPSDLEISESHELLRLSGRRGAAPVRAHACPFPSQAVDVPRDAETALALLERAFQPGPGDSPERGGGPRTDRSEYGYNSPIAVLRKV